MDIYTIKKQFEKILQPAPTLSLVGTEEAWNYFKLTLHEPLDEDHCEKFGFSVSVASYFDGKLAQYDENLFQVYFGRLIDPGQGYGWRVADINFYYRYEINSDLKLLLSKISKQDIETAYCKSEDEKAIRQKIDKVVAFSDEKQLIWDAIRELEPVKSSFQFWIQ